VVVLTNISDAASKLRGLAVDDLYMKVKWLNLHLRLSVKKLVNSSIWLAPNPQRYIPLWKPNTGRSLIQVQNLVSRTGLIPDRVRDTAAYYY